MYLILLHNNIRADQKMCFNPRQHHSML